MDRLPLAARESLKFERIDSDFQMGYCPAQPAPAALMSGDRRTDRLPDLLLLRSAATAWTDGWASRLAADLLGRPLLPFTPPPLPLLLPVVLAGGRA